MHLMSNQRSPDQTNTTISLPKALLIAGRKAAQKRGIDFSRLVRQGLISICKDEGVDLPGEDMDAPPPRGVPRAETSYTQAASAKQKQWTATDKAAEITSVKTGEKRKARGQ